MKLRWLPKGYVEAPPTDSPDGMLRFSFDGFDQGSGMTTLEVVFNSSEKRLDIYELGTVKPDGSHPPQPLGTAMLISDNLIQVRCTFDIGNQWDIDCIFIREDK